MRTPRNTHWRLSRNCLFIEKAFTGNHEIRMHRELIESNHIEHGVDPRLKHAAERQNRGAKATGSTSAQHARERAKKRRSISAASFIKHPSVLNHPAIACFHVHARWIKALLQAEYLYRAASTNQRVLHIGNRDEPSLPQPLKRGIKIDVRDMCEAGKAWSNLGARAVGDVCAQRAQKTKATIGGFRAAQADVDRLRAARYRIEHQITYAGRRRRERGIRGPRRAVESYNLR